jgi:hypothetical protein
MRGAERGVSRSCVFNVLGFFQRLVVVTTAQENLGDEVAACQSVGVRGARARGQPLVRFQRPGLRPSPREQRTPRQESQELAARRARCRSGALYHRPRCLRLAIRHWFRSAPRVLESVEFAHE